MLQAYVFTGLIPALPHAAAAAPKVVAVVAPAAVPAKP
jgi:hypothetical protein